MSALRVTRVTVNHAGIRRMLGARFMQAETERRMELVRLLAIAIAPVDTGDYVSRFSRPDAIDTGVNERGAAYSRLSNNSGHAYFLEVGTERMRAQRILRRALRAAAD